MDYKEFWETRYKLGGDSGLGSYGDIAIRKAEFINKFIDKNAIISVVEFGCGDGNNLGLYLMGKYTGLDISKTAIEICKKNYDRDFEVLDNKKEYLADLSMSIDVLYHIMDRKEREEHIKKVINSGHHSLFFAQLDPIGNNAHINNFSFRQYLENNSIEYTVYPYKIRGSSALFIEILR